MRSSKAGRHLNCWLRPLTRNSWQRDRGCRYEVGDRQEQPGAHLQPLLPGLQAGPGGGSGLGLAIARWIAAEHGDRVEVTSELEKGNCFTCRFPAA